MDLKVCLVYLAAGVTACAGSASDDVSATSSHAAAMQAADGGHSDSGLDFVFDDDAGEDFSNVVVGSSSAEPENTVVEPSSAKPEGTVTGPHDDDGGGPTTNPAIDNRLSSWKDEVSQRLRSEQIKQTNRNVSDVMLMSAGSLGCYIIGTVCYHAYQNYVNEGNP